MIHFILKFVVYSKREVQESKELYCFLCGITNLSTIYFLYYQYRNVIMTPNTYTNTYTPYTTVPKYINFHLILISFHLSPISSLSLSDPISSLFLQFSRSLSVHHSFSGRRLSLSLSHSDHFQISLFLSLFSLLSDHSLTHGSRSLLRLYLSYSPVVVAAGRKGMVVVTGYEDREHRGQGRRR
jgi:hypothetical protein